MTPNELPASYSGPPLRIAYVSNTKYPWCTEVHMGSSLKALGHSVHYLQEDELDWSTVPALVEAEGIQLLLWTRTWPAEMNVVLPVLKELEAEGIVTASVHLDRWFGLDRQHQVDDQPFFRTSLVVSPDDSPKWAEHGVNHYWLPPGVYGPECEPVPPNPRRWPYDVVFVGSHPYPHPEWAKYRSDLLAAFTRAFGRRFGILPRRGVPIRGRDLQELYATVPVVLGDSCLAGESHRYWSDRVPETLGRGGLLIHPMVDGMTPWYRTTADPGHTDFMGYRVGQFDEAVALAKWALQERDVAEAIAIQGSATVLARDTYAHRMGTVLAVAEGIHGGYREVSWEREVVLACDTGHIFTGSATEAGRPCPGPGCGKPLQISQESPKWKRASPEVEREAGVSFSARIDPPVSSHRPVLARRGRWSARFDLRPGEVGEGERVVIREVWDTNDYRVEGFRGTVVDIGANIGAFSVLASRAGARRVIAFEPDESNFARLTHHIEINRASRVTAHRMAVTGDGKPVRMVGLSDGAHSEPCSADDPGSVPSFTLADIIAQYGPIEFLKCDAEGAEFSIFEAVPTELLSQVKCMALEWHAPVVTHLMHLRGDEFGPLVTKLADAGRVETFGHPGRGGLIWWRGYHQ